MKQGEIHWASLDPTVGSKIQIMRPCLVMSPNEMNQWLKTIIAAPMTSQGFPTPLCVPIKPQRKSGPVILNQLRALDKVHLALKARKASSNVMKRVLAILQEMLS